MCGFTPFQASSASARLTASTAIMSEASSIPRVSRPLKTKEELEQLVESYDNWLFDCDGMFDLPGFMQPFEVPLLICADYSRPSMYSS